MALARDATNRRLSVNGQGMYAGSFCVVRDPSRVCGSHDSLAAGTRRVVGALEVNGGKLRRKPPGTKMV